jgi:putative addiction module component (TIGR02574 family)
MENQRYEFCMVNAATSYEQLEKGVLHLPREDRSKLASRLLESLEEDDFELSPEWAAELDRRVKEMDEGKAEMISSEDFWKEINQRFGTNF